MECSNCGYRYFARSSLIRHIQTSHPEEVDRKCYKIVKNRECYCCATTFSTRKSLIHHWRHFHFTPVSSTSKEKTWDCVECAKKYTNKFSWYKHKQLYHPNSNEFTESQLKKIFECSSCEKKYSSKRSLSRHLQSSHLSKMAANLIDKPLECKICGKRYTRNTGYTLHMKRVHTGEPLQKLSLGKVVGYDCPICQIPFEKKPAIYDHFFEFHHVNVVSYNLEFETRHAFDEWRTRMEQETRNNFSIRSSQSLGNYHSVQYSCSRSGFHIRRSTGQRKLKKRGSRKIGGFCPAEIRLKVGVDDRCQVQFTSTHVGHNNELAHMRLNNHERESIVAALDAKVPIPEIMRKFATPSPANERSRVNVVRHYDVRNVLLRHGREKVKKGQTVTVDLDPASVPDEPMPLETKPMNSLESWVMENSDSLLYAKCAGTEDPAEPSLAEGDFVFVLMTAAQKANLAERGNELVCVRRLRKPLKYRFYLTALLVRMAHGRHYACAFLLSNREDVTVYRMLLRHVCRAVPQLRPQVLIGPVAEPFYEAWVQEMGQKPGKRLFCLRDVLRTLKRRVKAKVKSAIVQKQLYSLLDQLMFSTNEDKFFGLLDVLKVRLETEDRFRRFFEITYETCVEHWAYCCAGVDANSIQENFYSRFNVLMAIPRKKDDEDAESEQIPDAEKKNTALLNILARIREMIDRQEYKQVVIEEWGETELFVDKVRYRHKKTVLDFENVSSDESGSQWMVMSASKDVDVDGNPIYHVYAVEKLERDCVDCQLICLPCRACVHDYKCSCPDAEQRGNMCCHIHLVCQYRMRKQLDDDQHPGMLVEEIIVE